MKCNDNPLFISIHWEIKRILDYIRKSARGDQCFKSSIIMSSQSVKSIRFTATMELGIFYL